MPVDIVKHPTYYSWQAMRHCVLPQFNRSPRILRLYAGISMCMEWREFRNFEQWAYQNGWQKGLHLTRRDKKGDFCPENCFWATIEEANGWRSVVRHLPDGRTIRDVIGRDRLGMDRDRQQNVSRRVFSDGWDLMQAVERPVRKISPRFHSRKTGDEAPLYNAWRNMRRVCISNDELTYSADWDDYEKFRDWSISNGWRRGMFLRRSNTKGNYSPDNCFWSEERLV